MVTINSGRGDARLRAREGVLLAAGGRAPRSARPALNQAAGFLRNGLFKRLHIHTVPTLHFQFDQTTERAADMSALIRKANRAALGGRRVDERGTHRLVSLVARCTACCCSTSRWASPATRRCRRAKRLLRAEKAGHTGTLDPLADGLLPLCFGAATKFAQACLDADKSYRATLALGERTATGDRETPVIERRPVNVDRAAIDAACRSFIGAIEQVPPMHSALKKDGKALYDYARAGLEVERAPRRVTIHAHRQSSSSTASGW